ncbi:MAG: hypothetical protein A2889_04275 [Nitrospinae bacterium RIFCSPLOWO2_01_FULL_39_10]|nr:MAG: hypothetical protein A2889_04275 [Nitrospinae bacterium RIFCSPLOWO2_01_FULL_39_10]
MGKYARPVLKLIFFMHKKTLIIIFLIISLFFQFPNSAVATELPLRGIARGEPKIKVGDKSPLITPDLEKANKEGKVIALMLGYQTHCPWCDRMDRYIRYQMEETKNFDNRVVFIMWQTEHAKMIAPPDEGIKLKEAFGTEGQPWLFLIDKEGIVRYIYKMFVSGDVFKRSILELLGEKKDVPVFDEPQK